MPAQLSFLEPYHCPILQMEHEFLQLAKAAKTPLRYYECMVSKYFAAGGHGRWEHYCLGETAWGTTIDLMRGGEGHIFEVYFLHNQKRFSLRECFGENL